MGAKKGHMDIRCPPDTLTGMEFVIWHAALSTQPSQCIGN